MGRGQQEAVLATVCVMRVHPTADEIYDKLKRDYPRLSLGTVYRNLNALAQKGDIRRVCVPEGGDRFDYRLDRHEHMLCAECGRVYDVNASVQVELHEPGMEMSGYSLIFNGTCAKCLQAGSSEKSSSQEEEDYNVCDEIHGC